MTDAKSTPENPWPVRTVARKLLDWINRLGETSDLPRAAELLDLAALPETLERLVPPPAPAG